MRSWLRSRRRRAWLEPKHAFGSCASAWLFVALLGCENHRVLEARSPDSSAIAELWWVLLAATGIPAVLTILVLLLASLRSGVASSTHAASRRQIGVILVAGGIMPVAIVFGLLVHTVQVGSGVTAHEHSPELTIDVVGRQFWWEVRYPDHDIVTANEIHIPAGRHVRLRITSADVIHSFWVPQLHGKRDMIPGKIEELWIRADEPGVYRGQCAEFCGVQHALMLFELVAEPPANFEAWLAQTRMPAERPLDGLEARGHQVFFEAKCAHCHTIRGITPELAMGVMGPDLTHLASRRTLGAAIIPNDRGHLGGWILNPHVLKPGNNMPPSTMTSEDLHALLAFLETLH